MTFHCALMTTDAQKCVVCILVKIQCLVKICDRQQKTGEPAIICFILNVPFLSCSLGMYTNDIIRCRRVFDMDGEEVARIRRRCDGIRGRSGGHAEKHVV
jgi:hypothetical protein